MSPYRDDGEGGGEMFDEEGQYFMDLAGNIRKVYWHRKHVLCKRYYYYMYSLFTKECARTDVYYEPQLKRALAQ